MLHARTVAEDSGVAIADIACRHRRGRGEADETAPAHAVVFVRRGAFTRVAGGTEALLDPTVAFAMNPGEEQRYDHPHDEGDDCTAVFLPPALVADLPGDRLPAGPLPISPQADLEHRRLLRAARVGDGQEAVECAIALALATLTRPPRRRSPTGRPAAERARATLADQAREALAHEPTVSLSALAQRLAVSPHHLSRVFRAQTGETVSRHRNRLRTRAALERLAGGERDLARLAAELGFADHSHLCRVVRRETGQAPSGLRRALDALPPN